MKYQQSKASKIKWRLAKIVYKKNENNEISKISAAENIMAAQES
jgi:hypothetical protein